MSRLIDADKLEKQEYWGNERCFDYVDAEDIDNAPTVDAVPVVRCKGCKHYRNYPNGLCYLHTEPKTNARGHSGNAVCVEPDDFCSYGERKDGGDAEG
jgi:hypothetical protein